MRARMFCLAVVFVTFCGLPLHASLVGFQTYTGNVGYSADGMATLSTSGTVSASVPAGSTVVAAYLYSASFGDASGSVISGTLNGTPVAYGSFVLNPSLCCGNGMKRADVTDIVKPTIDAGAGGVYDFTVGEDNSGSQDGEALVVVYENPGLPTSTVAILDGFSSSGGDFFNASFGSPLDPTAPGFFAEMALGISFSCGDPGCSTIQSSTVEVNETVITNNTGNYDDSDFPPPGNAANGRLLTMGGYDDPFSAFLPGYDDDHERYSLVPYISVGDTNIFVQTNNPTNDDNIFVSIFYSSGEAVVSTVPEPSTIVLFGSAAVLLGLRTWRRRRAE